MNDDAASRAVQEQPVGSYGMTAVDSGTDSYRFITWKHVRKSDRPWLRQQLQNSQLQSRTYLCVYCGHFTLDVGKHLQGFSAPGQKGCNMRFVQNGAQRSHLSSLANASVASAGSRSNPKGHLEAVHANLSIRIDEIQHGLRAGFRQQARAAEDIKHSVTQWQGANTQMASDVRHVRQKVDVLAGEEEKVMCMACLERVAANDAVRCKLDMNNHNVCQGCFTGLDAFTLAQNGCKCRVPGCGGELCAPAHMSAAVFELFKHASRQVGELEVSKAMQQEKERGDKMSPTERLVEVLKDTLIPKCPGTLAPHPHHLPTLGSHLTMPVHSMFIPGCQTAFEKVAGCDAVCCSTRTCKIHFCPICFWCPDQQVTDEDMVPGYAIHQHMLRVHRANRQTFVVADLPVVSLQRETLMGRAVLALDAYADGVQSAALAKCVALQVMSDGERAWSSRAAPAEEQAPAEEPAPAPVEEPAKPAEEPAQPCEQPEEPAEQPARAR